MRCWSILAYAVAKRNTLEYVILKDIRPKKYNSSYMHSTKHFAENLSLPLPSNVASSKESQRETGLTERFASG